MSDRIIGLVLLLFFAGIALLCLHLSYRSDIGNKDVRSGWRMCAIFCAFMAMVTLIIIIMYTAGAS